MDTDKIMYLRRMHLISFVRNGDWDQKNINISMNGMEKNGPEIKEYCMVYRLPTTSGL